MTDHIIYLAFDFAIYDMDEEEAIPLRTFTEPPKDKAEEDTVSGSPVIQSPLTKMDNIDIAAGSSLSSSI